MGRGCFAVESARRQKQTVGQNVWSWPQDVGAGADCLCECTIIPGDLCFKDSEGGEAQPEKSPLHLHRGWQISPTYSARARASPLRLVLCKVIVYPSDLNLLSLKPFFLQHMFLSSLEIGCTCAAVAGGFHRLLQLVMANWCCIQSPCCLLISELISKVEKWIIVMK